VDTEALPPPVPTGTNLKDTTTLISLASKANGLEDDSLRPWHIKANYEEFDENGNSTGTGAFEEWWVGHDKWKRSYRSSRFTQIEYKTPDGHQFVKPAGAAPWPDSLVALELIDDMPGSSEMEESTPELREQRFGKNKLSCVMFSQPLQKVKVPLGVFPTYCFERSSVVLRVGWFDGDVQAVFNKIIAFQGRFIPKEISLSKGAKPLVKIDLESLNTIPASEIAALTFPQLISPNAGRESVDVPREEISATRLKGPIPVYPQEAKQKRIQGKVVLKALIGTDGHVQRLRVVSSPDPSLSIAALEAVQQWIYKPYLRNDEPVTVNTTLNVVFWMGG